jgi:hypothetical protein
MQNLRLLVDKNIQYLEGKTDIIINREEILINFMDRFDLPKIPEFDSERRKMIFSTVIMSAFFFLFGIGTMIIIIIGIVNNPIFPSIWHLLWMLGATFGGLALIFAAHRYGKYALILISSKEDLRMKYLNELLDNGKLIYGNVINIEKISYEMWQILYDFDYEGKKITRKYKTSKGNKFKSGDKLAILYLSKNNNIIL